MSVSNGQLANAATFNGAFVSKSSDSTISATLTQDKESVLKEIATPSTPASGYGKIYFKNDGKLYQLNDAGIETEVGSGAGGGAGGVNFISNGNAEDNNTTGWATYADAAGTSPVDGTGGTANVTITSTSTTPLAGTYSFLMAKDAVNRQGQGWSYAFTIDATYKAKVLQISFDYLVNSGTFAAGTSSTDSDVTVWIYDVTNAQVIQGSSYKLLSNSTSLTDTFRATFQSASNSTSYRLIFHVGSTSASAYTLEVDNVSVSPSVYAYGTPVTDWQSYTPTFTNLGTVTGTDFKWRRVGGVLEIIGYGKSGTIASNQRFTLPSGLNIDTSIAGASGANTLGFFNRLPVAAGSTVTTGGLFYDSALGTQVLRLQTRSDSGLYETTATAAISNNEGFSCRAFVPIQGWSSSVQTSDTTDTRVVAAAMRTTGTLSLTSGSDMIFTGTNFDSHGAYNSSLGRYVCPVSGIYTLELSGLLTTATKVNFAVHKNGNFYNKFASVAVTTGDVIGSGAIDIECSAGDYLTIRPDATTTLLYNASLYVPMWNVRRLSGPSAIAASESVNASYYLSANFAASTTVPINFDTREIDSHLAVTTSATAWRFTAPIGGVYQVECTAYATTTNFFVKMYKNGTIYKTIFDVATANLFGSGGTLIRLNAGDYIDLRPSASITVGGNVLSSASHVSIFRVGN